MVYDVIDVKRSICVKVPHFKGCLVLWAFVGDRKRTESGECIDEHNSTMRGVQRIVGQSRVAGSRGMATEAQRKCIFSIYVRKSVFFCRPRLAWT